MLVGAATLASGRAVAVGATGRDTTGGTRSRAACGIGGKNRLRLDEKKDEADEDHVHGFGKHLAERMCGS